MAGDAHPAAVSKCELMDMSVGLVEPSLGMELPGITEYVVIYVQVKRDLLALLLLPLLPLLLLLLLLLF